MTLRTTFECIFELLTGFPLGTGAMVDLYLVLAVNAADVDARKGTVLKDKRNNENADSFASKSAARDLRSLTLTKNDGDKNLCCYGHQLLCHPSSVLCRCLVSPSITVLL